MWVGSDEESLFWGEGMETFLHQIFVKVYIVKITVCIFHLFVWIWRTKYHSCLRKRTQLVFWSWNHYLQYYKEIISWRTAWFGYKSNALLGVANGGNKAVKLAAWIWNRKSRCFLDMTHHFPVSMSNFWGIVVVQINAPNDYWISTGIWIVLVDRITMKYPPWN